MTTITPRRRRACGLSRSISDAEFAVIQQLLVGTHLGLELQSTLRTALVREVDDGGTGGILFVSEHQGPRTYFGPVVVAEYFDDDHVCTSIALNVDQYGDLYELDFWKFDLSKLIRFPKASDLRIKRSASSMNARSMFSLALPKKLVMGVARS